jgi:lipopolysaccharide export system protein LptC
VQVGEVADSIDLETVTARLDRQGGGWVTITSQTGRYEQKANHVILTGQVHLKDDEGYDVVTEKAEINLAEPAHAFGDQPVTGMGPKGRINANGFRITDEGKTVMFTGRATLNVPGAAR